MKKLIISLLAVSLSCFAGQLSINYNTGSPTVIEFSDIASLEIVTTMPIPANMLAVTGGTFSMGDEVGDLWSGCSPVHSVALNSFYICKYEVTQTEWIATMGTNPSNFTDNLSRPVESVSWYDILVYCNKRSIAENLTPCYTINGSTNPYLWGTVPAPSFFSDPTWDAVTCNWSANGYRLPTEAEWEFAARGGNSSLGYTYSGSSTLDNVGWYSANSSYLTHVVGTKTPNELGLYDMSGNVTELTWDLNGDYSSSAQTNPTGATSGSDRIFRGGTYGQYDGYCRIAYRYGINPSSVSNGTGFRLVRNF